MNKIFKGIGILMYFIFPCLLIAQNADYNWTYTYTDAASKKAFLWIPSSCASGIKVLLITQNTSIDELLFTDSVLRKTAEAEQMAILFSRGTISPWTKADDTTFLLTVLDAFATQSGFSEIKHAPWITWGHSMGTNFADATAFWKPSRTVAVITHSGNLNRPSWTPNDLPNVPFMAIKGQFEEWSVGTNNTLQCGTEYEYNWVKDTVIKARAQNASPFLGSVTIRPGEGHMGINNKLEVPLIALFIKKAISKRIPKGAYAIDAPITLNPIEAESGWLSDTTIITDYSNLKIDTFPNFTDPKKCFWHIDKEMAYAWYNFQHDMTKTGQKIANVRANPPLLTPSVTLSYGISATNDCGLNFSANNLDMSQDYKITNMSATSGLSVKLLAQDGPGLMLNDSVLRINPCTFDFSTKVRLLMRQEGSYIYQICDRQIALGYKKKTSGTAQTANIDPVSSYSPGDSIAFNATLSSGLTPTVMILSGPGKIENGKIKVLPFTSRSGATQIILRAAHVGNTTYQSSNIAEIAIDISSKFPNAPGGIVGLNSIAPPSNNVSYSISPISNATSYQWTIPANATIVSGQGTNSILVNYLSGFVGGEVSVKGVNSNGDGAASSITVNGIITGLNDHKKTANDINVYPNPCKGSINIANLNQETTVLVYNLLGNQINSLSINQKSQLIKISDTPGIYIVKIISGEKNILKKIKVE